MAAAHRQIAMMQSRVQVQQDAMTIVDRQMRYLRQQLSSRLLDRYQNNYRFAGGP
jgi:conjugative transfer pilus assembly protein TraH